MMMMMMDKCILVLALLLLMSRLTGVSATATATATDTATADGAHNTCDGSISTMNDDDDVVVELLMRVSANSGSSLHCCDQLVEEDEGLMPLLMLSAVDSITLSTFGSINNDESCHNNTVWEAYIPHDASTSMTNYYYVPESSTSMTAMELVHAWPEGRVAWAQILFSS